MNATVADVRLAANLAVPNVRARLSPGVNLSGQGLTKQDHIVRLSNLHPDERLGYLEDIGFTAEELDATSNLVENWLSVRQRKSLDEASREACQTGEGLDRVMATWAQSGPFEALAQLVNQGQLSQPVPALCYAVCAATELAWSMLVIQELDSDRKPIRGGPDAAWAKQDQETAKLDLQEEVSRWPQ
jgi:hypothetical protein